MTCCAFRVDRVGHAVVQDLGRPGHASIGIPVNGAADQHAARTGNILVGNAEGAPLVEVTGSELAVVAGAELILAVTGAAEHVLVDGYPQPAWETLAISRGSCVMVPSVPTGLRSYLAVNGAIECRRALGSVAPDPLIGVAYQLDVGEIVTVRTSYRGHPVGLHVPFFRLGARRPATSTTTSVDATPGPDLVRMTLGPACLDPTFEVLPQSNHVGLRLHGPPIEQNSTEEILSRGVPVGAIEVTPTGGIIILLRGRLVTAGYPVIAVVTTDSLDRLGQVRPGDCVQVSFCDVGTARVRLRARETERKHLATRVRNAFISRGLGAIIDPLHGTNPDADVSGAEEGAER